METVEQIKEKSEKCQKLIQDFLRLTRERFGSNLVDKLLIDPSTDLILRINEVCKDIAPGKDDPPVQNLRKTRSDAMYNLRNDLKNFEEICTKIIEHTAMGSSKVVNQDYLKTIANLLPTFFYDHRYYVSPGTEMLLVGDPEKSLELFKNLWTPSTP